MAEFYESMYFIVKKMGKVRKRPQGWDVLTEGGGRLAEMETSVPSRMMRLARAINFSACFPQRVDVLSKDGKKICTIQKPLTLGNFKARISAPDGKTIARVRQKKRIEGRTGHRIEIIGDKGLLGYFEGDWRSWNMEIFDERAGLLGRITKRATKVNRVIYADDEHHVVALSRPIEGELRRKTMMATAAALDLLMG